MRMLSALATLLVGLAFVFLAPPAKADCPHNKKTNHPHCPGDTELPTLVLRASDGSQIGTVLGTDTAERRARWTAPVRAWPASTIC